LSNFTIDVPLRLVRQADGYFRCPLFGIVCKVKNAAPYPVARHVEGHSSEEQKKKVLEAIGYKQKAPLNVNVLKEPPSSLDDFVPPKKRSVQFVEPAATSDSQTVAKSHSQDQPMQLGMSNSMDESPLSSLSEPSLSMPSKRRKTGAGHTQPIGLFHDDAHLLDVSPSQEEQVSSDETSESDMEEEGSFKGFTVDSQGRSIEYDPTPREIARAEARKAAEEKHQADLLCPSDLLSPPLEDAMSDVAPSTAESVLCILETELESFNDDIEEFSSSLSKEQVHPETIAVTDPSLLTAAQTEQIDLTEDVQEFIVDPHPPTLESVIAKNQILVSKELSEKEIHSNKDPFWTPLSDDPAVTTTLTMYQTGLHLHIETGLICCQKCNVAVSIESLISHLNNQDNHTGADVRDKNGKRVSFDRIMKSALALIRKHAKKTNAQIRTYLMNLHQKGPFPFVLIKCGYKCCSCSFLTTSEELALKHSHPEIPGVDPVIKQVYVQEFFNGTRSEKMQRSLYVSRFRPKDERIPSMEDRKQANDSHFLQVSDEWSNSL
jgi:hypothetical protein